MASGNNPNAYVSNQEYVTDFKINGIALISPGFTTNPLDLMPFMVEMSYFEDLHSTSITGNVVLSDTLGILNFTTLNGTEFIKISFAKANEGNPNIIIDRTFRIFSISNRAINKGNNYESYIIEFCSEELMLSEQYRISKSYKGKLISDIVSDIMKTYLKVGNNVDGTKNFFCETTKGIYDFVLPNKKIFQTINWLCQYAQPANGYSGADMFFYENSEGYNFRSLQSLFLQESSAKFTYNPKNIGENNLKEELYEILKLEILNSFDTLSAVSKGTFFNRVTTIDPLTRTKNNFDFKYNDYYKSSKILNNAPITNDYKNRHGLWSYDAPPKNMEAGVLRLVPGNSNQGSVDYIKSKPGTTMRNNFIGDALKYRVAQTTLHNYYTLKITVPGNCEVSVGDIVDITILPIEPSTDKNRRPEGGDEYLSGKYLVSAARHMIFNQTTYITVLEIVKESIKSNYASVDVDDAFWKSLVDGNQR